MPNCRGALLALALLLNTGFFAGAKAHAREAASAQELHIGTIVTRTSEAAQAVLQALKAGMDFGVLAKENSIDPSADDGGYIGPRLIEDMPPVERDALIAMHGKKFSAIVPVPTGFAILTIFPAAPKAQDLDADQMNRLIRTGVVRQSISVAGLAEFHAAFRQYPKPEGWERDLQQPCLIRNQSHAEAVARLERKLAEAEVQTASKPPPRNLMQTHQALAQLHAYMGDLEASISEWTKAYQIAQADVPEAHLF